MLVEFKVQNFKNFKDEIVLNLESGRYEFNTEAVKDGVIKNSLIYGINGSGKSNLALALFDVVLNLTDNTKILSNYLPYLNLNTMEEVKFYYKFKFNNTYLVYQYKKSNIDTLLWESVEIDGKKVLEYDHKTADAFLELPGSETLHKNLNNQSISFVKYVKSNAILSENERNDVFNKFLSFVEKMLMFSSLEKNQYQGFKQGISSVSDVIIESGKLKDFEKFLSENGVQYSLFAKEVEGNKEIWCKFDKQDANFYSVASKGTSSLALFYRWYITLTEVPFVVIDEFDSFYNNKLAKAVVKALLKVDTQVILTTHNTHIMDNRLLRPDCYFKIQNNKITSLSNLTEKDLREAHNIEKMFNAGHFDE